MDGAKAKAKDPGKEFTDLDLWEMPIGEAAIHEEARRNGRAISGIVKASGIQSILGHVMHATDELLPCSVRLRSPRTMFLSDRRHVRFVHRVHF